jgi:tRNA (adenine57-N1/adenine58-N1)-methyltransferase
MARATIRDAGINNLRIITGDFLKETEYFSIIHLDLGLTPDHIRHACKLLVPGGSLACYTPFFEQMALAYDTGEGLFSDVMSYECIMRDMDRSERGTRPSTRVCHSGYITILKK